jgi:hypothetical protein
MRPTRGFRYYSPTGSGFLRFRQVRQPSLMRGYQSAVQAPKAARAVTIMRSQPTIGGRAAGLEQVIRFESGL